MSGFVGIVNLDGSPVDPALLDRLTRALAFRGPDGQAVWLGENVGLGHAMFRATREADGEHQPFQTGNQLWIVADARVDDRSVLIQKLNEGLSSGPKASLSTPDVELILAAYQRWGEACVEHLLGDFSFAIWDSRTRALFCARDQLGVKPFYYAQIGQTLIFSNTIDALRVHPGVSSRLSDAAIGDFLLFGLNSQTDRSAFEEIKKLPPAHRLTVTGRRVDAHRYWAFPIEEPLRYRHRADYIDEFRALLTSAVDDRLRTDRVTVSMSGGLDSPTVAAAAAASLSDGGSLQAVTLVHDEVIPDEERKYAAIVARFLRIPVHFLVVEDYKFFERCESDRLCFPEPIALELAAISDDRYRRAAAHGRVMLTGEGGDAGLVPSLGFYRGARVFGLLWGIVDYCRAQGRVPRLGFHLAWLRWRGMPTAEPTPYPPWLEPAFASRANLQERWREVMLTETPSSHPDRPAAHASASQTLWASYCEGYDAASTRVQLEVRHPLLDLRMLRFMVRLPTLPWCADKELLRVAMRGALPEDILCRAKSPLAGDPYLGLLRRADPDVLTRFAPHPALENFVVLERVPTLSRGDIPRDPSVHFRPASLNYWLRSRLALRYK